MSHTPVEDYTVVNNEHNLYEPMKSVFCEILNWKKQSTKEYLTYYLLDKKEGDKKERKKYTHIFVWKNTGKSRKQWNWLL